MFVECWAKVAPPSDEMNSVPGRRPWQGNRQSLRIAASYITYVARSLSASAHPSALRSQQPVARYLSCLTTWGCAARS